MRRRQHRREHDLAGGDARAGRRLELGQLGLGRGQRRLGRGHRLRERVRVGGGRALVELRLGDLELHPGVVDRVVGGADRPGSALLGDGEFALGLVYASCASAAATSRAAIRSGVYGSPVSGSIAPGCCARVADGRPHHRARMRAVSRAARAVATR